MKIYIMNGQGGSGKTTFQDYVAEIIDEGTVYNDIFICVESKNEQFEPGILYFVRDSKLLSPINITVHNKEEVIKNLSKAGVTVKKVNWE